jgi:hypothetical protein
MQRRATLGLGPITGPPARIPGDDGEQFDDLPMDVAKIRAALLDAFDRQRQVDLAARLVARHLQFGHSPQALITTLDAMLREAVAGPLGPSAFTIILTGCTLRGI